jgi:hypothetical protein
MINLSQDSVLAQMWKSPPEFKLEVSPLTWSRVTSWNIFQHAWTFTFNFIWRQHKMQLQGVLFIAILTARSWWRNFPPLLWNSEVGTIYTAVQQRIPSWTSCIQSTQSHSTYLQSTLSSSHLYQSIPFISLQFFELKHCPKFSPPLCVSCKQKQYLCELWFLLNVCENPFFSWRQDQEKNLEICWKSRYKTRIFSRKPIFINLIIYNTSHLFTVH